VDMKSDRK